MEYGQQVTIKWWSMFDSLRIRFNARLVGPRDVIPRIEYRTNQYQGRAVSIVANLQNAVFPIGDAPRKVARYAAGSDTALSHQLFSGGVEQYVRDAVDVLNKRGAVTLAAYKAARAAQCYAMPSRASIEIRASQIVEKYRNTHLRSGTLLQTAALETDAAVEDRGIAEKHWGRYAEEHGLNAGRYGFDHYTWACAWLERCGLLVDVVDGKACKYGATWY
jgi:hypothetical protein